MVGMAGAGVAWPAWLTEGDGTGSARATVAQVLTTTDASAMTSGELYPGGVGNVALTVVNPNRYPVRITSVAGSGPITSDKGPACDAATGVSFIDQTGAWEVAAGASTSFTLGEVVSMSNASDTSCQGAMFSVPVHLVGASAASS